MTATEARKKFFDVIDAADHPGVSVVITHEGLPKVVVMSFDEFEGWQETLEIMSDTELMKDIREALQETETIPLEELEGKLHARKHVRRPSQAKGKKAVRGSAIKRSKKSARRAARSS